MNKFKLKALKGEFPFVEEVEELKRKKANEISEFKIKRIDENLLNEKPLEVIHTGSLGKTEEYVSYYFFNEKGKEVKVNPQKYEKYSSNYQNSGGSEKEGESLLEAIDETDATEKVAYILEIEDYYRNWEGQDKVNDYNITLYKPPKGKTIKDYINEAKEQAKREILEESAF